MTLPTKDEAKRAAETLEGPYYPGMHDPIPDRKRFDDAITLLKAYAAGELVEREKPVHDPKEHNPRECPTCWVENGWGHP